MEIIRKIEDGVIVEITPIELSIMYLIGMKYNGQIDSFGYCDYNGNIIHKGKEMFNMNCNTDGDAYPVKYYPISDTFYDIGKADLLKSEAEYYIDIIADGIAMVTSHEYMVTFGDDGYGRTSPYPLKTK